MSIMGANMEAKNGRISGPRLFPKMRIWQNAS